MCEAYIITKQNNVIQRRRYACSANVKLRLVEPSNFDTNSSLHSKHALSQNDDANSETNGI